ncbi:IS607 family transposase [Acidithiobacillus sp. MC6.1]|nr:IS607 family transposase [Acidithiobacillus sp. MC6.1]
MGKKLSDYAKERGIGYRAAWNRFKAGRIPGAWLDETGHVVVPDASEQKGTRAVIYARASSAENRPNLESQAERLGQYATVQGWQVVDVVKETGSGVNDHRKKLEKLLRTLDSWDILIVEHKDRLTRFGFHYIHTLLSQMGKHVEVVNLADNDKEDLVQDLVAVIYSFSARMYGLRRSKRRTERLLACLEQEATDGAQTAVTPS